MKIVKPDLIMIKLTHEEYKTIRLALQHFEHCESNEFNEYGLACIEDLLIDFNNPVYVEEKDLRK